MSNDRNFREEILDQLSDGSIMSLKKMSHSLAVPQEDLTETLAELVEEGEIMRSRSGNLIKTFFYNVRLLRISI